MNATSALPRLGQVLALVFVLTGSHALGQTITQTGSFTNLSDAISGETDTVSGSPIGQPININQFDPSLGTLNSVTIDLTNVVVSGQATVINNAGGARSYSAVSLQGMYTIEDSNNDANAGAPNVFVTLNTQTYASGTVLSGASFTTPTEDNSASPGSGTITYTAGAEDLSNYIGTGTTGSTVFLFSSNSVPVVGPAPYSTTETSLASGDYTVTYNYTPVPEPSKTAACMIGFALCLLVGRNYFKGRGFGLA